MQQFYDLAGRLKEDMSLAGVFRLTGHWPGNRYAEYLRDGKKRVSVSYADFKARALACAAALRGLPECGTPGVVGLQMPNGPDWGCVFWALLMNGQTPVLLDAAADARTTRRLLAEAGATLLVGEHVPEGVACISPAALLASAEKPGISRDFEPNWADQVVFCSSGTQRAKLCVYSGEALCHQIIAAWDMPKTSKDIMYPDSEGPLKNLALLPFHHIFGFVAVFLWYSFFGRTLVFLQDNAPGTILKTCQKLGVTHVYGVPMLWNRVAQQMRALAAEGRGRPGAIAQRLVAHAQGGQGIGGAMLRMVQKRLLGTRVRFCISGGSYISPETLALVDALGYPVYNGYGLTEAGITSVELQRDAPQRLQGSVGSPLFGVQYAVRATGGDANAGELLIKSGYLHVGTLEKGVFAPRQGEWLETGDLVLEEDGRYFIRGKLKDTIIGPAGENIAPEEVESYFAALPYAAGFCVVGIKGPAGEERVTLVVEPAGTLNEAQLLEMQGYINTVNGALPLYKMVRHVVLADLPIPLTGTMKVKRQALVLQMEQSPLCYHVLNLAYTGGGESLQASEQTVQALRVLLAGVLGKAVDEVGPDAHFVFDLNGDSMAYAEMMARIEDAYGFRIPPGQYARCTTARQMARLVDNRQHLLVL